MEYIVWLIELISLTIISILEGILYYLSKDKERRNFERAYHRLRRKMKE